MIARCALIVEVVMDVKVMSRQEVVLAIMEVMILRFLHHRNINIGILMIVRLADILRHKDMMSVSAVVVMKVIRQLNSNHKIIIMEVVIVLSTREMVLTITYVIMTNLLDEEAHHSLPHLLAMMVIEKHHCHQQLMEATHKEDTIIALVM
jgi:hypothetical protein